MKQNLTFLILFSIFALTANAQNQFTPYDDIPGIERMYKPAFSDSYTGWKKMLYEYPVNFIELEEDYRNYILQHPNEKSAIIRYFKIWKRVVIPYTNKEGKILLPDIAELKNRQFQIQKNTNLTEKATSVSGASWSLLGPKETFWRNEENISANKLDNKGNPKQCPWQVNVYSFDVAPSDSCILYCGTETGFVNKSTDKGLSWFQVGTNYPFGGGVTAVAIHPGNSDTVYVSAGKQIHKTSDGGNNWSPLLLPQQNFGASRMRINPENPNILAAAADDGMFISTDAGTSWERKWSRVCYDIEFKPLDPKVIFGLSKNSSGNYQVIISQNNGESFSSIASFPENYTETSGGLLAVTVDNPNILYVTLLAEEGDETVPFILKGLKSSDTYIWEEKKKGEYGSVGGLGGFTNGQGYFDLVLEADPNNENTVFWGTCSLWKSTDGGTNFTKVGGYGGDFDIHPDIQDMQILDNGETWVATDGGMNYSSNLFTEIENYSSRTKGIIGSDMWGFDQGWNEDIVVGGRYHNGNTAISDLYNNKSLRMGGGESATGWVIKGKSRHVAFNDLGNGWILPKTAEEPAEGRFIFSKFPNMDEYGGRRSNMVQHPNYYGTIFLGEGNSMWKSDDSGETFDLLFQFTDRIRYFQISHKNPDVLYADIVGKGLYRSEDGGKRWEHKPALTNGSYGNSYWNGKLFFVISPHDENKIYACLQNGAWSGDIGKVFRSVNGGTSWEDWTSGLDAYTECIVIQPVKNEQDLLYMFTHARNDKNSKVYYRYESQPYWNEYNTNYPAGMSVNLALPFYRDSKIRVAGNAGVWESPMLEPEFVPILNPWVQKQHYDCMEDTLYFDDHSIINHSGASWEWTITPEPEFISNKTVRNPKVVLGNPGYYDVTMKITQNSVSYQKTIQAMVSTTTCPSVNDCNNPADVDNNLWTLLYVDSEEINGEDGAAINAFDGDQSTIWHSEWYNNSPGQPHEIRIDMGREYEVSKIKYLPRQNSANGRIKKYEIYLSTDTNDWGEPVDSGEFGDGAARKTISITPTPGRYLMLRSLSEQNDNKFTSIAELDVTGCIQKNITGIRQPQIFDLDAFPIPAKEKLNISVPQYKTDESWTYRFYTITSEIIELGNFNTSNGKYSFDVSSFYTGTYILTVENSDGKIYRIKFIKN